MVDVSALIVAIVSLTGTAVVAVIGFIYQYFSAERARLTETEKLVRKYRDPVLWAANELQSRFYNTTDQGLLNMYEDPAKHDLVVIYTAYLIGQYFTWISIFRRQAQFLSFASKAKAGTDHKRLNDLLIIISDKFATDRPPMNETAFMLWRGQQSGIGELMTVHEGTELMCMGYAAFLQKWNTDKEFKKWFVSIEEGLAVMVEGGRRRVRVGLRLVHLQHLLYELLCLLDPQGLQWDRVNMKPSKLAFEEKMHCKCRTCVDDPEVVKAKADEIEREKQEAVTQRFDEEAVTPNIVARRLPQSSHV